MGVELHLSGTVKQEVRVTVCLQLVLQPVQICFYILHTVEEPPVGAELQSFHHIVQSDQLRDIHTTGIWKPIVGRVHIHHHHLTSQGSHELLHPSAVGGFTRARRSDDHLAEPQRVGGSRLTGHGSGNKWTGSRRGSHQREDQDENQHPAHCYLRESHQMVAESNCKTTAGKCNLYSP